MVIIISIFALSGCVPADTAMDISIYEVKLGYENGFDCMHTLYEDGYTINNYSYEESEDASATLSSLPQYTLSMTIDNDVNYVYTSKDGYTKMVSIPTEAMENSRDLVYLLITGYEMSDPKATETEDDAKFSQELLNAYDNKESLSIDYSENISLVLTNSDGTYTIKVFIDTTL